MRKLLPKVIAAVLLTAGVCYADPPAVVRVDRALAPTPTAGGTVVAAGGTGTVVAREGGRSLVLTARHVAPGDGARLTVTADGKAYPAEFVAADRDCDLALVAVRAALPFAHVAAAGPVPGERLSMFGRTTVSQTGTATGPVPFVTPTAGSTIYSVSGDSGAGVFDPRGDLVMVHWGRSGMGLDSCQCGTPACEVRRFLRAAAGKAFPEMAKRLTETAEPPLAVAAKPTVTVYSASWCQPCQAMHRTVLDTDAVRAACTVVTVDVSGGFPPGVTSVPTATMPGRRPLVGCRPLAEFLAWVRGQS